MSSISDHAAYVDTQIRNLEEANPLREPTLRSIISALNLPSASRGLDIGCGIGLQTSLLAEAIGPTGHVTGMDISPELLAYARTRVRSLSGADRITFREGDMQSLPFPDNSFDWVWSADCVGYPTGDLLSVLKEIVRVVRPSGTVAILAWTSQQVLPGYTLLEARLNALGSAYAPFLQGQRPESFFTRALCGFAAAGITQVTARTFVGDIQAPLSPENKTALVSLFEMLWDVTQPSISLEDKAEYRRLCRKDSANFVLDLPDYYGFFTYTLFSGKISK